MHYEVEGQEIHPEDHKNSELNALNYAIKLACEYAGSKKIAIFRVDDGKRRRIKYTVPPQPVKERKGFYPEEKDK